MKTDVTSPTRVTTLRHTFINSIRCLTGILGKGEITVKLTEEGTRILFRDMQPCEVEQLTLDISTCINEAIRQKGVHVPSDTL